MPLPLKHLCDFGAKKLIKLNNLIFMILFFNQIIF